MITETNCGICSNSFPTSAMIDGICERCVERLTDPKLEMKKGFVREFWRVRDARVQIEQEVTEKRNEVECYAKELEKAQDRLHEIQRDQSALITKHQELGREQIKLQSEAKKLESLALELVHRKKALTDREWSVTNREENVSRKFREVEDKKMAVQKKSAEASELIRSCKQKQRTAKSLDNRLAKRAIVLDRQETRLDEQKRRIPPPRKKLAEELAKTERRLIRSKNKSLRLNEALQDWQDLDGVLEWARRGLGRDSLWPYEETVAVSGEGPYNRRELSNYLAGMQFDTVRPGDNNTRIMIVGRDGWSEESLEKQIQARQGDELRIYSQEMFLLATALARDPLEECEPEYLIELFGNGHSALESLIGNDLCWPNTEPDVLSDQPWNPPGVEESPLHILGYHVGVSSELTQRERRSKLRQTFDVQALPFVHSDEYMHQWGRPGSPKRLWRMAHHLASLARRRDPRKRVAGTHWNADLAWMKKTLFKPWMNFRWPSKTVP